MVISVEEAVGGAPAWIHVPYWGGCSVETFLKRRGKCPLLGALCGQDHGTLGLPHCKKCNELPDLAIAKLSHSLCMSSCIWREAGLLKLGDRLVQRRPNVLSPTVCRKDWKWAAEAHSLVILLKSGQKVHEARKNPRNGPQEIAEEQWTPHSHLQKWQQEMRPN